MKFYRPNLISLHLIPLEIGRNRRWHGRVGNRVIGKLQNRGKRNEKVSQQIDTPRSALPRGAFFKRIPEKGGGRITGL
jgi:hypothetical protein